MEWQEIVSLAIGIAGALFGIAFLARFQTLIKLLQEMSHALDKTANLFDLAASVLKDRKVTKAEAVLLLKGWQDAYQ